MKMVAKTILVLLSIWGLPFLVLAQFTFTTNNGAITITGYTGSDGSVVIPSTINGWPVASIGPNAFYYCTNMTNVTIGANVTSIGDYAFKDSFLTSVTIPDNVTNIGSSAFSWCPFLIAANTGNGVTRLSYGLFDSSVCLASVTISTNTTNIGTNAFAHCSGLTNVVIPKKVVRIEDHAFASCSALARIEIPSSVTSIGDYAFNYCTSLSNVLLSNGITEIGNSVFSGCLMLPRVVIPSSVTNIGDYAFYSCQSLTNIILPSGISQIGNYAFATCFMLHNVTIPSSVTNIGEYAFAYCFDMTGVFFNGNVPSAGFTSFSDDTTTIYYLPESVGWSNNFAGQSAVLWNPTFQTNDPSFGVLNHQFGFNIIGTTNIPVVVESCTNLDSAWAPLQAVFLTNGLVYINDSEWTNYPSRLYRLRSP